MAEFNLERFKYTWKGNWQGGTAYQRDDIVKVNGKSYVCLISHTASSSFFTDLDATLPDSDPPQPQPKWIVMTDGKLFVGNWTTTRAYYLGDIVLKDGSLYVCTQGHTANVFSTDFNNWELYSEHIKYLGDWQTTTDYGLGAVVKYGGKAYKCVNPHSSTNFLVNIDNWEEFYEGIEYKSNWNIGVEYKINDIVKYGASLFRVKTEHTSSTEFETYNFELEFPGSQLETDWNPATVYNQGDIVRYGGNLYFAIANNTDSDPARAQDDSSSDWSILAYAYNFRGSWSIDAEYKPGDVVLRGGQLFVALQEINRNLGDGSTLDYLDDTNWELLAPGKIFSYNWSEGNTYSVGEVVYHLGSAYMCNLEHVSDNENFPGDNGSGYDYWDLLVQGGVPGGLHDKGDLLTYGLSRTGVGDGSTLGDIRVPIGDTAQLLSITEDHEVFWRNLGENSLTVFVTTTGEDAPDRGLSQYKPFRTIRYACEFVEDNYEPLTPFKIFVSTGRYDEVGPISVPAGCVVMGDELRSTTVVATAAIEEYQNDYQYVEAYLDYFIIILFDLLNNTLITKSPGNTLSQDVSNAASDLTANSQLITLLNDYKNYIEFRIQSGSIDPTKSGSNTVSSDPAFTNASAILNANKEFIANEIYYWLVDNYPLITFTKTRVVNDVRSFIRGLARDINYSGNYATLLAARRYSNSVLGSGTDDLFYMRDTTGLRNMTTDGLTGTLNPPGVFDLYQRPTGGACVSLDPGWGPDDERMWIINRSPYIQGVTNLGTRCVGKKVDGSLHNGGNKSMTSNDFTQVLSDGIGAWILNNGRAELVSVFTYYCQVGYLAEDGGVIRATNGNNSYGSWGAISDGNDPTETPQNVTVFNRNNEAQVETAFSGTNTDKIFIFEYSNAGENYTTANADIVGAGANASVEFEDFRDNAIFNARLVNTKGSGSEGGSNYLVRQGFAQITADSTSTIRLSATDATQFESEILGMRILIIAGQGSGQYGYIAAYDQVTRDVTVRKESDGELGWDHVVAGTAIASSLDSTAQYRIEPRIEVSHPGFTATSLNFPVSRQFIDCTFGDTTEFYNNITGQVGTGELNGVPATAAIFNITKNGRTYDVTVSNAGTGYAVGDTITIPGTSLGGTTPANDLTITVTSTTDDSTNSILTFTSSGEGTKGNFVALADPNFIYYSQNGETWTESNTTFAGDFKKIISGKNRFIALASNENRLSFSYTGEDWITRSLPSSENWIDGAYGDGTFVIIAEGGTSNVAAYSTDGLNWTSSSLPVGSDSTVDQYQAVAYGAGKFVAITGSQTLDVAVSEDNGKTWTKKSGVLPAGDYDWVGLSFGNNRFLAIASNGETAYSIDHGTSWTAGTTVPNGGNTLSWKDMKFAQGVFFALATDTENSVTTYCATTEDGLYWYERNFANSANWSAISFASLDGVPTWLTLSDLQTNDGANKIVTGSKAILRAEVFQGSFQTVKIWNPGSGYATTPTVTVTDNQFVTEVEIDTRLGDGVLAQPNFVDRGSGYRTSTSVITITGDGYADIIPEANTVTFDGVSVVPGPGVQIRISTILDPTTEDPDDELLFNGVTITDLGDDGSGNGTRLVQMTISPSIQNEYNLEHGTSATLRSNYSQCRISGHDFLDIGTGNFEETNYPEIYADGAFFVAAPENEVYETNGGRVFYTSTDQDGNFRTGELFGVNQATGVVTISAEFFDLDGLSELSLGGVRLGGSGTVVREFSTDPTFAEDSNNVVPTQRAIASFLAERLSVGGENLETNLIQAGTVRIGGESNIIETSTDNYLYVNTDVIIDGEDALGNKSTVSGTIISQMLFYRNFNDTVQ